MKSKTAADRYEVLASDRTEFLDAARTAAALSLPYLLPPSGHSAGSKLKTPWQSMGARGVNVMASKLMLALFPVNTSFFKLQVSDGEFVANPQLNAKIRSEVDQSLAKMERIVNQSITGGMDRVTLTQAVRHAVATGNGLLFDHKKGLKFYPFDRFVCVRDGNSQPVEIITVEGVDKDTLPKGFLDSPKVEGNPNGVQRDSGGPSSVSTVTLEEDEVLVYTWAKVVEGNWMWHQEAEGKKIPKSQGMCPVDAPAWIPCRFNVVDGENYGRGRVEEFIGDLKSLEGLMQTLVEGSAEAAKIRYLLNPGAISKPKEFAEAENGDILVGRPEDLVAVQLNKQADLATAYQMIMALTKSLSEAFLILSVRQSERTTAEEVQATRQEVMEQLGGILGTLTTEVAVPFLKRRLAVLQRKGQLPKLPKGLVLPTVVAGLDGIGRGQDREALVRVATTIQQVLGPEVFVQKVNADEFLKRLFAAEGIDPLELLITPEVQEQAKQDAIQNQTQQTLLSQVGQLAKAPLMDPSVNPNIAEAIGQPQAAAATARAQPTAQPAAAAGAPA
jgi:hypothetical protein